MLYLSKLKEANSFFKYLIVFLVLEIFSYLNWQYPEMGWFLLTLIGIFTIFLVYKKPIFYLYIPLAEIFWGSLGHSIEYGFFSFRLLLFLIIFFTFILSNISQLKSLKIWQDKKITYLFFILSLVLFFDIVWGYFNNQNIKNVFFDANAYFYIFYLPIWYEVYDSKYLKNIFSILKAAAFIIAIKTLFLLNVFSQSYNFLNIDNVYKWVRDTRTGEITPFKESFFRIFMQSQFYLILAWFWLLFNKNKHYIYYLALLSSAIYISLSRSFWLGIFVGFLIMIVNLFIYKRDKLSIKWLLNLGLVAIAAVFLVQVFYNLPQYKSLNIFTQRSVDSSEAAASTRVELWTPMWENIFDSPIIGHGFGKEISYRSSDPRIKNEANPEGWHTSYAFEWGFLDQLVKGGIILLTIFITWIGILYRRLYQNIKENYILSMVFISSLTSLLIIHIFTPYINHPLGLSLMMLITIIFGKYGQKSESYN